jgi:hypothetical protein
MLTIAVEPPESAVLDDIMQHSAVQIITAGFKGQQNHTSHNDTQTVFTQLLVEGISGNTFVTKNISLTCKGKAFYSQDLHERDWISTDELSSWLQRRVSERTIETQFPQYERLDFGTKGKRLIFCFFSLFQDHSCLQTLITFKNCLKKKNKYF